MTCEFSCSGALEGVSTTTHRNLTGSSFHTNITFVRTGALPPGEPNHHLLYFIYLHRVYFILFLIVTIIL